MQNLEAPQPMASPWKRANTDWFHQARWGTFIHYLADTASCLKPAEMNPDEWNRRVESFDVDRYAQTLADLGCPYTFLTVGQNSGYYCAPNAAYDAIVGRNPSRLSRRDLVADLGAACAKRGIRLLVYFTSMAPVNDLEAVVALRCTPPWDASRCGLSPDRFPAAERARTDERLTDFQLHWEAVIREWGLRWGALVHGWWIDGCYYADPMYRQGDAPNFRSFAEALKSGNQDRIVAFCPGSRNPVVSLTEYEDYTAGEIANTLPINGEEPCVIPVGRWVNGAQYHILNFLGGTWGRGSPRFTDEMVGAYTRYVNSWGGVVTWDHPVAPEGRISDAFLRQLEGIR